MINDNFWQGILLKLSFRPEKIKRTQAALIYAALAGDVFTADCVPKCTRTNTTSGLLSELCRVQSRAASASGMLRMGQVALEVTPQGDCRQWRLAEA